jgi:hypothetical protein
VTGPSRNGGRGHDPDRVRRVLRRRLPGGSGLETERAEAEVMSVVFAENGVLMHECNDCGILIADHLEICSLCERWYKERGLPLAAELIKETLRLVECKRT